MSIIDRSKDTIRQPWPPRQIVPTDEDVSLARLTLDGARRFGRVIALQLELRRSRKRLHELPDDLLRDVGLTRAEANAEADRSFLF